MLKITYTDTGLLLEQVGQTVEAVVSQRLLLAVRLGKSITVQPTYASLPLPADLPGIPRLKQLTQKTSVIEVSCCDSESTGKAFRSWLEVTLQGVWIADSVNSDEGIFVTELEATLEKHLLVLWQGAQVCPAEVSR